MVTRQNYLSVKLLAALGIIGTLVTGLLWEFAATLVLTEMAKVLLYGFFSFSLLLIMSAIAIYGYLEKIREPKRIPEQKKYIAAKLLLLMGCLGAFVTGLNWLCAPILQLTGSAKIGVYIAFSLSWLCIIPSTIYIAYIYYHHYQVAKSKGKYRSNAPLADESAPLPKLAIELPPSDPENAMVASSKSQPSANQDHVGFLAPPIALSQASPSSFQRSLGFPVSPEGLQNNSLLTPSSAAALQSSPHSQQRYLAVKPPSSLILSHHSPHFLSPPPPLLLLPGTPDSANTANCP